MRSLTLTKGREIKDATKEDNEGLEKVEEVAVGGNMEDDIKGVDGGEDRRAGSSQNLKLTRSYGTVKSGLMS